jgi:hypothetical protein
MKSLTKIVVAASLVILAFVAGIQGSSGTAVAVETTTVQHMHGCAIRLLSTGPVLLRDSAHHCNDQFTAVSVTSGGDLDITYHVQGKIVVVNVTPDETLAKRDVTPGVSVGLEHMYVSFGRDQVQHSALSSTVTGSSSNIWLWVVTEETITTPSPSPTAS